MASAVRSDIETAIAKWLNRAGDTNITDMIPEWFDTAHRGLQRKHNFECMQQTWSETIQKDSAGNIIEDYCVPDKTWKKIETIYTYNQTTKKIVDFYEKTDIRIVRQRRHDDSLFSQLTAQADPISDNPNLRVALLAAIWNQMLSLWPTPDKTLVGKQIRVDVWRFLDAPSGSASDWFTVNARDYLIYRSLMEASPYLANDSRIPTWERKASEAWADITGMDIDSFWAGELVMRG